MLRRALSHHPRHDADPRLRARAAELGLTLIEVITVLAILAVIIVPLGMTLATGFRVTEWVGASINASINRDVLASRFTADVAGVDAAGASTDPNRACDSSPSGGGTLHVSLNSTRLISGSIVINRVSYWVLGSGQNISIERRSCTNVTAGTLATGGERIVVADRLGNDNSSTASATVYAPYDNSLGARYACTEFRCGFEIRGRYFIQVIAQRRLFGAGVPVEIGKLYSSSYTRNPSGALASGVAAGVAYDTYDNNGNSAGKELQFTDQLTLPAGLDTRPYLSVSFKVYSATKQQCLRGTLPSVSFSGATTTNPSTCPWIVGDDSTGLWRMPLKTGPTTVSGYASGAVANAGGEYRVYTQLTEQGRPAKAYGGANGFPLWIDFKPDQTIFVSGTGVDTNNGCTPQAPVKTVIVGVQKASTAGNCGTGTAERPNVVIQNNNAIYSQTVNLTGANGVSNYRSLVGGYDLNWIRLAPDQCTLDGALNCVTGGQGRSTVIGAINTATGTVGGVTGPTGSYSALPTGVLIQERLGIRLRQLSINSGGNSNLSLPARSTYAVRMIDATGSTDTWGSVEYTFITAAAAYTGFDGTTPGNQGGFACWGRDGVQRSTSQVTTGNSAANSGYSPAVGCAGVNSDRYGGTGGAGGNEGSFSGSGSGGGSGGSGFTSGGSGGGGGGGGYCVTPSPGEGGAGGGGVGGNGGAGGAANATPSTFGIGGFTPGRGGTGTAGTNGRGGGGAGGGGGTYCAGGAHGASGGKGGDGGIAGTPGQGGQSAAGGFGVYLWNVDVSKTRFVVSAVSATNNIADGQPGASGGTGGSGGAGGRGTSQEKGGNSAGGGGGGGAGGGGGGAGGNGGPSVGVWSNLSFASYPGNLPTAGYIMVRTTNGGAGGAAGGRGQGALGGAGANQTVFIWFNYDTAAGASGGGAVSDAGAGATGQAGISCKFYVLNACQNGTLLP